MARLACSDTVILANLDHPGIQHGIQLPDLSPPIFGLHSGAARLFESEPLDAGRFDGKNRQLPKTFSEFGRCALPFIVELLRISGE